MEPVEVHKTRVGTGHAEVMPETTIVHEREQVPVMSTPRTTGYAETRMVNPAWVRVSQVIWLVAGILATILAFDFLFRLLGANDTGFANLIYSLGNGLAAPFDGIFGNTANNVGNGTIGVARWADLMAIVIYTLIAAGIVQIVRITTTPRETVSSSSSTVV